MNRTPGIYAGSNSCGGMTITDRTSLTIVEYYFDATGELVGGRRLQDDCNRDQGAFYGMRCSGSLGSLIDCGGKDAGTAAAGASGANSGSGASPDAG